MTLEDFMLSTRSQDLQDLKDCRGLGTSLGSPASSQVGPWRRQDLRDENWRTRLGIDLFAGRV